MSQFEKLMGELQTLGTESDELAKALPADDGKDEKKIQAAAEDGGLDAGGDAAGEGDGEPDGDECCAPPLAKSMKVTLEDGTAVEAVDGTALVKALQDQVGALSGKLTETETAMVKSLESAVSVIKSQGELLKSLTEKVAALGNEGRGRKAVVTVHERKDGATLAKSEQPGLTPDEFFAKALEAQKAGRITGSDVAVAEAHLNKGLPVPAGILQRVVQ